MKTNRATDGPSTNRGNKMNELTRYDLPFDSKTFIKWLGRVGKENLRLIKTAIEAADHIEETGYYELPAQFTTSGRPEIFWGETK